MTLVTEYIRLLPDKLRLMDVLLVGPAYIYGDNLLVLHNGASQYSTTRIAESRVCLDVDASMWKLSFCSIHFHFTVWLEDIPADIARRSFHL